MACFCLTYLHTYLAGTTSITTDFFYYFVDNPLINHGPWFKLIHKKKFACKNIIVYCFHSIIKDCDVTPMRIFILMIRSVINHIEKKGRELLGYTIESQEYIFCHGDNSLSVIVRKYV